MIGVQGMKNLVFDVETVIDAVESQDVWVIYKTQPEIEKYFCLNELLFKLEFDPSKVSKTYQLQH